MKNADGLEPCPFCGNTQVIVYPVTTPMDCVPPHPDPQCVLETFVIVCVDERKDDDACSASGPIRSTRELAVTAWNFRGWPKPPPQNESWQMREKRLGVLREAGCTCLFRDDGSRDLSLGCPVHNPPRSK